VQASPRIAGLVLALAACTPSPRGTAAEGPAPSAVSPVAAPATTAPSASALPGAVTLRPAPLPRTVEVPGPLRGQYVWEDAPALPAGRVARDSYKRWLWWEIEPARGSYRWDRIDAYVAAARRAGGRFGLRIMPLSTGDTRRNHRWRGAWSGIPDDLAESMEPLIAQAGGVEWVVPDWNSEAYLSRVEELVAALGERYRDEPALAWVDVIGYGNWGEFHLAPFDGRLGPYLASRQRPITDENARRLVRAHVRALPGKLLVIPTAQHAALAEAVATTSVPVGLREDCLGEVGMSGMERNVASVPGASEVWRRAPVITEWCNRAPRRGTLFGNGAAQVRSAHVSMLSSGNLPAAPRTPEQLALFEEANAGAGYRLRVESARLVPSPGRVEAELRWVNDGNAPPYLPFRVVLGVRGPATAEATMPADLRRVMPDAPLVDRGEIAGALPPGTYEVYVRVEDAQGISPPLPLAQAGGDGKGSHVLGTITLP
jgi:hypothetical protein